jgi:hypothetical protein
MLNPQSRTVCNIINAPSFIVDTRLPWKPRAYTMDFLWMHFFIRSSFNAIQPKKL